MIFEGKIDLDVPAAKTWDFLIDINKFSSCLPGLQEVKQIDDKTFDGVIAANVGPISGKFSFRAMIVESKIDFMIFFWDPMEPHPHDVDVKALLRISVLYNIPIACNRATADFMISSPLLKEKYERKLKDYSSYLKRSIGD